MNSENSRSAATFNAEMVVLTEDDIPGAKLHKPFERHKVTALRWWLLCGLQATSKGSHHYTKDEVMYTVIHRRILGWPLYVLMQTTIHTFVWENIWDLVTMAIMQK